jgi:hypothetical protein
MIQCVLNYILTHAKKVGKIRQQTLYHAPKSFETSHESMFTIWNQQARTNRINHDNNLDITIRDNKKGTCMLIDVEGPGDKNVIKKEAENILRYKDLKTEIQGMWNVKAK